MYKMSVENMTTNSTLTVDDVANILGISRGLAYESARRGDFPVIRLGKRLLIPRVAFERWLSSAGQQSNEVKRVNK